MFVFARGSIMKKIKITTSRAGSRSGSKIRRFFLTLVLLVATAAFAHAQTYTATATTPLAMTYSDTLAVQVTGTITTSRDYPWGKVNYYYLISGATIGDFSVGNRKLYLDGNPASAWLAVYVRPTTTMSEIGTTNTRGTTVISGTMGFNVLSSDVQFNVVLDPTRTGTSIPDGTYQNTFIFSLYTGSLVPPKGKLANVFVSVTVIAEVKLSVIQLTMSPTFCDFGSMVAGNNYSVSTVLLVESNRTFSIVASSEHSGKLYLSDTDAIPYKMIFEGKSFSLADGNVQLVSLVPAGKVSYKASFDIVNLEFVEPGTYKDTVTFLVTSP